MKHIKDVRRPRVIPGQLEINGKIINYDKDGICKASLQDLTQSEQYDAVLHIAAMGRYCEESY